MAEKISALLICYNEQHNIQRFIEDASYAEEIIIVDSFSTDKTEQLAINNPKVTFVKRKFDDFTSQRNYAISLAKNDWVTFFDADEELPKKLVEEIETIVYHEKTPKDAYYAYHTFYFNNKKINFSGQQNVKAVRLFRKSKCKYVDDLKVHESLVCNTEIGKLKHKVKHHTFVDEKYYLDKLNGYSKLRAEELYIKKLKPNFYHYYIKPAYRFFNYYILRLGFLDGIEGFKIAKLHTISIANRYKYLDEIYEKEKLQKK